MAYSNTQINNWINEVKSSIDSDNHWHKQSLLSYLNQRILGHIDDTNMITGINNFKQSTESLNTWTASKIEEIINA